MQPWAFSKRQCGRDSKSSKEWRLANRQLRMQASVHLLRFYLLCLGPYAYCLCAPCAVSKMLSLYDRLYRPAGCRSGMVQCLRSAAALMTLLTLSDLQRFPQNRLHMLPKQGLFRQIVCSKRGVESRIAHFNQSSTTCEQHDRSCKDNHCKPKTM